MPMGQEISAEDYAEYQALKSGSAQAEAAFAPQLTAEEIAEYRELRESARRAQEEFDKANTPPPPTHYLHLADGSVIESAGTMTHYKGQTVVLAVPKEGSTR